MATSYLVSKKANDGRMSRSNLVLPDQFFLVLSLTFENQPMLKRLKPLYNITQTDLPEGYYAPNGRRVTEASIWEWFMRKGKLDYIDAEPEEELVAPERDTRPPDMDHRPDYIGLDDITADEDIELPPAVALARKIVAQQEADGVDPPPAEGQAATVDSEIPTETDEATLAAAGATDEVAMLRAALDARGVKYHPSAKAPTLRKKLEDATA